MANKQMASNQLLSEIETLQAKVAELEESEYALMQTADALRETRERFLHLIEHTPDLFFVIEEDGHFIDVNERTCQSLGYAREELLVLSITDIDDEFNAASFKEALAHLALDVPAIQKGTFRRKDGTTFPVEVRISLTAMEGKRQLFTLARDVSEQKKAQEITERLAKENAVLAEIGRIIGSTLDINQVYERFAEEVRKLIPFGRIAIHLVDIQNGTFRNAYNVGIAVPGRQVGDVVPLEHTVTGRVVETKSPLLFHGDDVVEVTGLRNVTAGLHFFLAVPLISDNEVIGSLHLRSAEPDAYTKQDLKLAERIGDQIAGAIANSLLYTELKQTDEALQESEARFRQVAEHMPVVFWLHDFETEQVLYVSPAYKDIFLSSPDDLYEDRRSWMETIHPDDKERVRDIYENHRKEEMHFEFRIVRPDDSIRWISNRRTPVRNEAGEIYRLVGIAEDITERKFLEEQLIQSQKLESVGRLAGGVAHDFNNLLTPIIGYSQMAMRSLLPEDKVRAQLQHIYQAADRASNLIHQLLTFSSKQIIEPKVVNLSNLILDMDHLLRRLIGEDIELITRPKPDLGLVKVDHGQLEQVLVNLAVNARDAMQDGGRLIIEADDITVDQEFAQLYPGLTPGEYVLMAVRDNGKGMTEEVRSRIFEPFYTTKARGKGTGLGLSICYGIVKQSGGHIFVDSEPGQGTTFKVYLPRVDGTVEMLAPSNDSHPLQRGTENVLLVEDEVSVREIVAYVLREQGYTVYEAVNGKDALRIAQGELSEELHLLITDVIMPGMGGVELVDHFKPLCPEIKVLFISGYTEDDVVHHGMLDRGTAVLLQKPFTPTELTNKVREVLDAQ